VANASSEESMYAVVADVVACKKFRRFKFLFYWYKGGNTRGIYLTRKSALIIHSTFIIPAAQFVNVRRPGT
jgi:hypothetical protein